MLEFIGKLLKTTEKKDSSPKKVKEESAESVQAVPARQETTISYGCREDKIKRFYRIIEDFKQGDERLLPSVYTYLTFDEVRVAATAAEAIAWYMKKLDYSEVCRLDDWFRQFTSMEWSVDWTKVSPKSIKTMTKEDYLWVLRLGTFHPSGFFREKCLRELKEDKESVPFIILRLNDWVMQVRSAAEEACGEITDITASEVITYILYLEKVKRGGRARNSAVSDLESKIRRAPAASTNIIDKSFVSSYDEKNRRTIYRFLANGKLLDKEKINNLISWEKNGQLQAILMTLLIQNYDVSVEELDNYIKHKSASVKYKALEQKYKLVRNYWDGLESLLFSRSGAIRAYVRFILRNHTSIEPCACYAERLNTEDKKICIQGIGECGAREDAEPLKQYLEDSDEGIVKVTLHAIGSLLREDGAEIYWRFLQDTREVAARQAYREIAAYDVRFGAGKIYNLLKNTESKLLKEKLSLMLLKEPVWEALPYILMLYSCEDEAVKKIIHPFDGRISTYSTMTSEHAEWIKSIMTDEKYKIPKDLQDKILFSMKYSIK